MEKKHENNYSNITYSMFFYTVPVSQQLLVRSSETFLEAPIQQSRQKEPHPSLGKSQTKVLQYQQKSSKNKNICSRSDKLN